MAMRHEEYEMQKGLCKYISYQYPDVLFISDTVAFVRLSKGQGGRNKAIQKHDFKCPDLLILEPRQGYNGLLLELKKDTPFKKDGKLKSSQHLRGQQTAIDKLQGKGYKAQFTWGFDMSKKIIDNYLTL